MQTLNTERIPQEIQQKFRLVFYWNLIGSFIYESLKTGYNFLLLATVTPFIYGLTGSTLSLIYFFMRIADIGTSNSLAPFLLMLTQSKSAFKKIALKHLFIPMLGASLLIALIAPSIYLISTKVPNYTILTVIPILIILETIRGCERTLLNVLFKSKTVVIIELSSLVIYLSLVWLPYIFYTRELTIKSILIPHVIDSVACVLIFSSIIFKVYKALPNTDQDPKIKKIGKRIFVTRFFNFILKATRELFSNNFLTPLFASQFGLYQAGIFYFAGSIATSFQSVIKVGLNYPTNALFANLRTHHSNLKKQAFSLSCQKLVTLLAPFIIFILISHNAALRLSSSVAIIPKAFIFFILFQTITIIEFFVTLYEQFYVVEEAAHKIAFYRIFETALMLSIVFFAPKHSITNMLIQLIVIKAVSLAAIAVHTYYLWKITPKFNVSARFLIGCATAAIIAMLFVYLS
jgi:hypothetical protein